MLKKLFALAIMSFTSISFFAQDGGIINDPNYFQNMRTINPVNDEKTIGTPYIDDKFAPLKILNLKGDLIYSGRFNAYNGTMEIKLNSDKIIALVTDGSKKYKILFLKNKKHYQTFNYRDKTGYKKNGFLEVVKDSDNILLLKEEKIKFIEATPATTSYDKAKPAKFKKEKDIYYLKHEGRIMLVPSKKKEFASLFPKNAKLISGFIKKNKLKLNKEEDLVKAINYLDSIL